MHCPPKNVHYERSCSFTDEEVTTGSGLMGEQGTESIHAHLMKLERTHQAIPYGADQIEIHNGAHA